MTKISGRSSRAEKKNHGPVVRRSSLLVLDVITIETSAGCRPSGRISILIRVLSHFPFSNRDINIATIILLSHYSLGNRLGLVKFGRNGDCASSYFVSFK